MRQVLIKGGNAIVEDVPAPQVSPGRILVRTHASCISVGTELGGLRTQRDPLWKRALKEPDKVAKALRMMAEQGVGHTMRVVKEAQAAGLAVGYSAAGDVIATGEGVSEFSPGDHIACAGAGYAMHADIISVPLNLTVPIPPGVTMKAAATVTLGAIALQGVRRAQPTLGESFVVFGLGVLGQITVQLLKANGCQVVALDLDRSRIDKALALGADIGIDGSDPLETARIARMSGGIGVDGVIVTAASANDTLLNTAFAMCRRKGRVVLVGDVPITIDRAAIYRNELEFLISTSYGPGRYDPAFEEGGLDYPIGYVRWTERRNMAAYLDLLAAGHIDVDQLIEAEYPIDEAPTAYRALAVEGGTKPLAVSLTYRTGAPDLGHTLRLKAATKGAALNLALIGASAFAKSVHLPNVRQMPQQLRLAAVCSSQGHQAKELAAAENADYATSDPATIFADPSIAAVMIAGRHHLHAGQALTALKAGKAAFVEKPLALSREELAGIETFYAQAGATPPLLLTGFNRRFAPAIALLLQRLEGRAAPLVITYRMNAGAIPHSHWTQGPEGGGRNIGEACHIYDLFTALTGARIVSVKASGISRETAEQTRNENFSAIIAFEDGSLATLVYTAFGGAPWPKEQMEVFSEGRVFQLDDYRSLTLAGAREPLWSGAQDKGHRAELQAFADALTRGGDWPIPLWQQIQATRLSFDVEDQLAQRSMGG